jgi:hypothetical protein
MFSELEASVEDLVACLNVRELTALHRAGLANPFVKLKLR